MNATENLETQAKISSKPSILHLDDEEIIFFAFEKFLRKDFDYQPLSSDVSLDPHELARSYDRLNFLLTDYHMNDFTGVDYINAFFDVHGSRLGYILLTGSPVQGRTIKKDKYSEKTQTIPEYVQIITKPISPITLSSKLTEMWKNRQCKN